MAAALVRFAVAKMQKEVFAALADDSGTTERLHNFIDAFTVFFEQGRQNCLLAVIAHHGSAGDDVKPLQALIATQMADWHADLARQFEEVGHKPKRALRCAQDLLSALYGGLITAKMLDRPKHFKAAAKRLRKTILEVP